MTDTETVGDVTFASGCSEPVKLIQSKCRPALLLLAGCLLLLLSSGAVADVGNQIQAVLRAGDLRDTKIAVMALDIESGQPMAAINADDLMIPASNMKLLTSAAALQTLGSDFMFRTELKLVEPSSSGGANLIVVGDGDPALGDPKLLHEHGMGVEELLEAWAKAVHDAGVKRVERIIIDDRVFDRSFVHSTWPTDQLHYWYCAQVAGLNFHNNCIDVYPRPTVQGQAPILAISPQASFLKMFNRAATGKNDTFWISRPAGTNELTFHGTVQTARVTPVNVTIDDPGIFFANLLAERLAKLGIPTTAIRRPAMDERLPAAKPILLVRTALPVVLGRCNKDSQNLFAEALFKRMGRKVTGAPGSWDNGAAALRIFLHDKLGAKSAGIIIADGSGMSRENRISPRLMCELLAAIHRDSDLNATFRDSLSVGGEDGTLQRRFKNGINGDVYGKSGYLNGVSAISGYIAVPGKDDDNAGGAPPRTVAFSIMFNDFKAPIYNHRLKTLQDQIVRLLDAEASRMGTAKLGG